MSDSILRALADLTGQEPPFPTPLEPSARRLLDASGIGYSQFNELLLLLGYDRVTKGFFQFLVNGSSEYVPGAALRSFPMLRRGVDRFRILAIRSFGNVKFGFKYLSAPTTDLSEELAHAGPVDKSAFKRHPPLLPITHIPGDKTYFLGYLIEGQLKERLRQNPTDEEAISQLKEREKLVEQGQRNQKAYLASDHMDVYVATSMRERHEFQVVNQVIRAVFGHRKLKQLGVRCFDPTQAYCQDRIDKGLAEALMLKRASCTLYLAQESDTLGKDSELASTLAQGKPVIAYIPLVTGSSQSRFVNDLLKLLLGGTPNADVRDLILAQLKLFSPQAAWDDKDVMGWIAERESMDTARAKKKLGDAIRRHYDKRAVDLKERHPLGIQVHLDTGVANGVLVARTTDECAELIYRTLTGTLEFGICDRMIDNRRYLYLREKSTNSVFRVVTGDQFLTNAYWNFYLAK
jgi:hypothetical protein